MADGASLFMQVMSIKAVGIAIELTLEGTNQFKYFQSWVFLMVSVTCIMTQLNYLNMVSISLKLPVGNFYPFELPVLDILYVWVCMYIIFLSKEAGIIHTRAQFSCCLDL